MLEIKYRDEYPAQYILVGTASDVYAGEDIPGTWDQYIYFIPGSDSRAVFIYCRETGVLEEDPDPDAWSFVNRGLEDYSDAFAVVSDILTASKKGTRVEKDLLLVNPLVTEEPAGD